MRNEGEEESEEANEGDPRKRGWDAKERGRGLTNDVGRGSGVEVVGNIEQTRQDQLLTVFEPHPLLVIQFQTPVHTTKPSEDRDIIMCTHCTSSSEPA